MSIKTRRGFLKAGAALGSFVGLSSIGLKTEAQATADAFSDPYFPEPQPKINNGPVFSRRLGPQPRPSAKFPVLQGATSQTQTQFRILIKANEVYRYTVIDPKGVRRKVSAKSRFGGATSQTVIDHVFVDGLAKGATYFLEIEPTSPGEVTERRQFSTMSESNGVGDPLRIALISCQNDRYVGDQADMWAAVAKSTPEIMIFNGDSCYVDQRSRGTVEGMWDRHVETRKMFDVFKWDRLVPILTTWDDHDTGENDSNSSNPYLTVAHENFEAMFGSDPVDGHNQSPGMAYTFDTNGMRFVMLDGRSSKTPSQIYSTSDEAWIAKAIATSPGPTWLVNGIQFFGGYLTMSTSVEDTSADQLWRILKMGRNANVPIMFMSGDVHFSELMELEPELLGYKSYELTSSPLYSRTFPGIQYRSHNGRRLESSARYNYLAIEMKAISKAIVDFETVCLGANDNEMFRLKAQVQR